MNIYNLRYIETPRLLIRPVQLGDEIEINQALNRSLDDIQRWMPWAKDPSFETTRKVVNEGVKGWSLKNLNDFPMVVIHKASNKIICASGYNEQSNLDVPMLEIGYWIDKDFGGQGYVVEFVVALTKFAFVQLNAARVQICTQYNNVKSINVAKRSGFNQEAELKNHCIDCLTDEPSDSLIYSCFKVEQLPENQVTWKMNENQ